MTRHLAGDLKNLPPMTLLRVLSATATSGVLELDTEAGSLRLEVAQGRVAAASDKELTVAAQVFNSTVGTYRFEPRAIASPSGVSLPLAAYGEAALTWTGRRKSPFSSEVDVDRLLTESLIDFSTSSPPANIHVLPTAPPENPLDDLLSDLETTAAGELLLAQMGTVTTDPRLWRGSLEADWRRRGWQLRLFGVPHEVPVCELDLLLIPHRLSVTRVGQEDDWTDLVRRASQTAPAVPVVWVGPLGDPIWVHRLIEAGVTFLMPPPAGDSGEALHRFQRGLTLVVDRQLRMLPTLREPELAGTVSELVDALLHEAEPEQAVSSLLQLAAGLVSRGAILRVDETAFRCRAGFGYPLMRGPSGLPRGVGLLERVVRQREPLVGIDPERGGALKVARVLGIDRLPAQTAVIPLGAGSSVGGVLVVDREGQPLPDLSELVLLVSRLGGVLVHS